LRAAAGQIDALELLVVLQRAVLEISVFVVQIFLKQFLAPLVDALVECPQVEHVVKHIVAGDDAAAIGHGLSQLILAARQIVAKEAGTVEVKVNSNVDFEVQIPSDATWITKTDSRALTEKSIFFKVAENTSEKPRNASITITNKECMLIDTLFVTQQGSSNVKLTYSTNSEELEGWSEGLFCNDGTYYMAKPSEGNACMVTIGSFLTEENCIIYIDENRHVREVFSVDKIFTFNNYTDHSVDISYFDENNVRKTETVDRSSGFTSRSSNAEANGINLGLNMWSIKEAVNDIAQNETTYKYGRGWQSYLLNVFNGLGTALEIGGGPENGLFNNTITDWIGHIDNSISLGEMGVQLVESLKIKNPQLKPGPGGPAVWAITAWLGFRATYLELYNEHIEAYYGNSLASIANITYENNGLMIDLKVTGYENLYNLEYGVIAKQSNLPFAPPAGKFPSNIELQTVTQNGTFSFFIGNKKKDESYWCYPFLISKSRDPLWIGFIGEMSGPLVRYGKAVKYPNASIIGKWKYKTPWSKEVFYWDFKENGIVITSDADCTIGVETNWKQENGILYIQDDDEFYQWHEYKIEKLTEKILIVFQEGIDEKGNYFCESYELERIG